MIRNLGPWSPTLRLKEVRLKPWNLLVWRATNGRENILFTVGEHLNKENHKVCAKRSEGEKNLVLRVMRDHHPALVMLWLGVFNQEVTALQF